jgi:60 kDa SS-A/Ro ribonucleoprotein
MSHKTYLKNFSTKKTPQNKRIPGKKGEKQVKNNAGGYTWKLDMWGKLDRFLMLGTEGGSYYVSESKLTEKSGKNVLTCLKRDGLRVVNTIVDVSTQGRAPKNDPAIFALAMAAKLGDDATRAAAFEALPKVCRIGTHLFHFVSFTENFGGWGRAQRRAISKWYTDKEADRLAYQVVKYQQRDGWSNRDLLRLAHPSASTAAHQCLFRWIVSGDEMEGLPPLVHGFEAAKKAGSARELVRLITDYGLTREMVPTKFLNDPAVWDALLQKMPIHAMVRNLGKMTQVGLLNPLSSGARLVTNRLDNQEALKRARMHPISVLAAMLTYKNGKGFRGSLTWDPNQSIVDALDMAFYSTFKFIEPTGKRIVLALDVSGSMTFENIVSIPGLDPRTASAALAMATARTEKDYVFVGFTGHSGMYSYGRRQANNQLNGEGISTLAISPRQRLDTVCNYINRLSFGSTDCALPMLWALKNKVEADAFVIYTDSESWAGEIHASQALEMYRDKTGIPAKLIPVGMVANDYTVGDPDDAGTLNVTGFDTATPSVISNFIRG